MPPIESVSTVVVRLSNEKPSVRIARLLTLTARLSNGISERAKPAIVTSVCVVPASGLKLKATFEPSALKKPVSSRETWLAVRLICFDPRS